MNIKVCKFGGTSMANKEAICRVKEIILSDKSRRFIVVSAPGKCFAGDEKVTDLLYACYDEKVATRQCKTNFEKIRVRFTKIVEDLELKLDIKNYLDTVEQGILDSANSDYAASRGEYLTALIMAEVLSYQFIDASDIIRFNVRGCFDYEHTNDLIAKALKTCKGVVIPGFYGTMPDGTVKTFSRGGSDYSGAVIARGITADVYENWTDVDGFMTTDPRVVNNPVLIDALSYEELRELSYMGASVLHPEATFPLRNTDIPINIKNTFNPTAKGTIISKNTDTSKSRLVTGIAGIKGFTTVQVKKTMMNSEIGFCRRVLSVLELYNISLEHMPTGIDTMSLIIPDSDLKHGLEFDLIEKIRGKVNPDSIYVYKDMSLIAIVGHGMSNQTGTAAKVFIALADANINIKMIDQGSSEINIIVGVNTADLEKAINALYNAFF